MQAFDDGTRLPDGPDGRELRGAASAGEGRSSADPARPRGSLEYLGTTVSTAKSLGDSAQSEEFRADLEHTFRTGVAPELARLTKRWRAELRRARKAERLGAWSQMTRHLRSARWAEGRARALGLPRYELAGACSTRWRTIACGCGQVELRVGCDQVQLCNRCRRAHWKRWRKRITRALGAHYRAALAEWRAECARADVRRERRPLGPRVYMVTLTGPHSGNLARDREAMGAAWRKLYKTANAEGWWRHYAATWEVGEQAQLALDERDGHLHLHVAVIARWLPFDELHAAWRAAMPGALVLDVSVDTPKQMRRRKKTNAVSAAAEYLASYVTKGVDPEAMRGAKAGELLVAFRNRRKVTTSTRFWRAYVPKCECPVCGQKHRMLGLPPSLVTVAPGAVLKSSAERHGVWLPRGPTQARLRYGDVPPDV